MLDKPQKLEVSAEELEVIEAALHTQSQILNVQANAGGTKARVRLNAVKRALSTLSTQKRRDPKRAATRSGFSWFRMARIFN